MEGPHGGRAPRHADELQEAGVDGKVHRVQRGQVDALVVAEVQPVGLVQHAPGEEGPVPVPKPALAGHAEGGVHGEEEGLQRVGLLPSRAPHLDGGAIDEGEALALGVQNVALPDQPHGAPRIVEPHELVDELREVRDELLVAAGRGGDPVKALGRASGLDRVHVWPSDRLIVLNKQRHIKFQ
eukprot:767463-Hanusia_phi.AAC.5